MVYTSNSAAKIIQGPNKLYFALLSLYQTNLPASQSPTNPQTSQKNTKPPTQPPTLPPTQPAQAEYQNRNQEHQQGVW